MMELSFELPALSGNPFDPLENDIRVRLRSPDGGSVDAPAFFDGGATWRVRFTPPLEGAYAVDAVTRNGEPVQEEGLELRPFQASSAGPGFVRIDPADPTRFRFERGEVYFPLGCNVGWSAGPGNSVPELLAKLGGAGANWSRVWMCHWDGKNLDWVVGNPLPPGVFCLDAARRWDAILAAAGQAGVYLHVVLQHHGQVSTQVDPNWPDHPWNRENGGFLDAPEELLTHPRVLALTRAKYRYILARWGFSPHVLAWELFNEVEGTDAVRNGRPEIVAAWHREMAAFLRAHDLHGHLVTTSADPTIDGLYDAVDFIQPHTYPADAVPVVEALAPQQWGKPAFYGEFGPGGGAHEDEARFVRRALWASLMSESSGAAQYWYWDRLEALDLFPYYRAASRFLNAAGPATVAEMKPVRPEVRTTEPGEVTFGPGAGWQAARGTEFPVAASGEVEGAAWMPAYLQGDLCREMFPRAVFPVDYPQAGSFTVRVRQVAKRGARLDVRLDGSAVIEREFPASEADVSVEVSLTAAVPAGAHRIELENTGADWLLLGPITLAPYGPALRARGKSSDRAALLWIDRTARTEQRHAPEAGTVTLPGLAAGTYRVSWWDTRSGEEFAAESATVREGEPLVLRLPEIAEDAAALIRS